MEGEPIISKGVEPENSNSKIKNYMLTMLKILGYLESKGIVHRDIKPSNILLSTPRKPGEASRGAELVLIDFGLSSSNQDDIKYFCGTPGFISPELYRESHKELFNSKIDVFSLGIIFHHLQFGCYPLEIGGLDKRSIVHFPAEGFKISGLRDQRMEKGDFMAYDLMTKMVRLDQGKRYGIKECLKHPYFRKEDDEILRGSLNENGKRKNSLRVGDVDGRPGGDAVAAKVKKLKSF